MIENKKDFSVLSEDAPLDVPSLLLADEPDHAEPKAQQLPPRKKRWFSLALAIYFVLSLTAIAIFISFFQTQLQKYEFSTPNAAVNQYIEWVRNEDYNAIYESSGFQTTTLNGKTEYINYLEQLYAGTPQEISARERISLDETKKEYVLYFDEKRVSTIIVSPAEEGNPLAWKATTQLTYQEPITVIVGKDLHVTVDGKDIRTLSLPCEEIQTTVFSGCSDETVYPTLYSYRLEGLLNPPSIKVLTTDGRLCNIDEKTDKKGTVYTAYYTHETNSAQDLDNLAETVSKTYAEFVARDATRNQLLNYVYKKSDFYTAIRNFSNSWFTSHESYKFNDFQLSNRISYTAFDFTCEAKFQPIYVRNGKTFTGELAHYRMTFLKINEEWLLVSLIPLASNTDNTNPAENQ